MPRSEQRRRRRQNTFAGLSEDSSEAQVGDGEPVTDSIVFGEVIRLEAHGPVDGSLIRADLVVARVSFELLRRVWFSP